ncbi:hypothetical protein V2O64_18690 [Verrucomicrobiaceae bacterium 227]
MWAWSVLAAGAWLVASCAGVPDGAIPMNAPAPPQSVSDIVTAGQRSGADAVSRKLDNPILNRPKRTGIATGWGREVGSAMTYTDFVRATTAPAHLSTIRYNDKEGARAMGVDLSHKTGGMQKAAGGLIEWGLSSGWGGTENYWWRGGRFVVGKKGREYEIKIKNLGNTRMEAVLSVDGLDVVDGKPGSTKKRGYIVNPRQTLVVKGFRTSHEAVASFKFSSVSSSYANLRHGETRNVGVIGLAIFHEKGAMPHAEMIRRAGARPFAEAPLIRARD